jgi:hypothetical protein
MGESNVVQLVFCAIKKNLIDLVLRKNLRKKRREEKKISDAFTAQKKKIMHSRKVCKAFNKVIHFCSYRHLFK